MSTDNESQFDGLEPSPDTGEGTTTTWTIPDSICVFRLVGSIGLLFLAYWQAPWWFVGVYVVLGISDLIDGPLARWLKQESALGASLDSLADVTLSICLAIGAAMLNWPMLSGELVFVLIALGSYAIAALFGFYKFGKFPSFHTLMAKITHFLVALAGVALVLDWSVWPLRIALASVVLTNFESLLISHKLKKWVPDVFSVFSLPPQTDEND